MTKTPNLKSLIEQNRQTITQMLSGADTTKRLNNLNWIRDELTKEAKILFQYPDYMPKKDKKFFLDFNNLKNLGTAWDYILKHEHVETIDNYQIREIHRILCENTDIPGGIYRISDAYIMQLGIPAPNYEKLVQILGTTESNMTEESVPVLTRAFNLHYDLIAAQPFNDFNKRTARLIMNWFLIKNGYRPILFNKRTDKEDYMAALRARAKGDTKTYSHYMYACMLRTQQDIIRQLKKSKHL